MRESTTVASVTNGKGVTITAEQTHDEPGKNQGQGIAHITVTDQDGVTIGFQLNRENRRRLRALIDMMDI